MWLQHKWSHWNYYLYWDTANDNLWSIYKDYSKNNILSKRSFPSSFVQDTIKSGDWIEVTPKLWAINSLSLSTGIASKEELYLQEQCKELGLSREQFLKQAIRVYQLYQTGQLIRLPETLHKANESCNNG